MHFFLILTLLFTFSCSKESSKKTNNPQEPISYNGISHGNYMRFLDDDSSPYFSKYVQIVSFDMGKMLFYSGKLDYFQLNPDGSPRAGKHPDTTFFVNHALYDANKIASSLHLSFLSSSCSNYELNPFVDVLPSVSSNFSQTEEVLTMQIGTELVSFNKVPDSEMVTLMQIQKQVYCNGEE